MQIDFRKADGIMDSTVGKYFIVMTTRNTVPRLYYFNALFDHRLGGYDTKNVAAAAAEMTTLFLPLGTRNDRVLLDTVPNDHFLEYLAGVNVETAAPLTKGEMASGYAGETWGWDIEAERRLESAGATCTRPGFEIVRKINGRQFCRGLQDLLGLGVPGSSWYEEPGQAHESVVRSKVFPLVIKPAFGSSGRGFILINGPDDLTAALYKKIEHLFANDGVIIEPWCRRIHDISSSFRLDPGGAISNVRSCRCAVNDRGVFYGVYCGPDPVIDKWRDGLEPAVAAAAPLIHAEGYFGPVGFDSIVYADNEDRESIALMIEINGRHVISDIAHALHGKMNRRGPSLFRFINRRHCRALPDNYGLMQTMFRNAGIGHDQVIPVTPLRVYDRESWKIPERNGFYISASSPEELSVLDESVRHILSGI